jgi:hypothetical protein
MYLVAVPLSFPFFYLALYIAITLCSVQIWAVGEEHLTLFMDVRGRSDYTHNIDSRGQISTRPVGPETDTMKSNPVLWVPREEC